jgi:hypothetical protein
LAVPRTQFDSANAPDPTYVPIRHGLDQPKRLAACPLTTERWLQVEGKPKLPAWKPRRGTVRSPTPPVVENTSLGQFLSPGQRWLSTECQRHSRDDSHCLARLSRPSAVIFPCTKAQVKAFLPKNRSYTGWGSFAQFTHRSPGVHPHLYPLVIHRLVVSRKRGRAVSLLATDTTNAHRTRLCSIVWPGADLPTRTPPRQPGRRRCWGRRAHRPIQPMPESARPRPPTRPR